MKTIYRNLLLVSAALALFAGDVTRTSAAPGGPGPQPGQGGPRITPVPGPGQGRPQFSPAPRPGAGGYYTAPTPRPMPHQGLVGPRFSPQMPGFAPQMPRGMASPAVPMIRPMAPTFMPGVYPRLR